MTPEVQLALVAAIVPTIAAVGAIVVVIVGNRRVAVVSQKADVIVEKVEAVKAKAEEIHTTSNGHLTAVTSALAAANEKINSLEKLVTAMVTAKKS